MNNLFFLIECMFGLMCGGQKLTSGIFLSCSRSYFLWQVSYTTWSSLFWLGWWASQLQGSCYICHHSLSPPTLYPGTGDLESGLRICMAHVLPQPHHLLMSVQLHRTIRRKLAPEAFFILIKPANRSKGQYGGWVKQQVQLLVEFYVG